LANQNPGRQPTLWLADPPEWERCSGFVPHALAEVMATPTPRISSWIRSVRSFLGKAPAVRLLLDGAADCAEVLAEREVGIRRSGGEVVGEPDLVAQ
jgi:hypothetical protein